MALRASNLCVALVKAFETERLKAYLCPAGKLTIGFGHTSDAGAPEVRAGMTISSAQALAILGVDIGNVEDQVEAALGPAAATMTQGQNDALVSMVFNIGITKFKASTLLKKILAGKLDAVPAEIMKWTKAKVKGKLVDEPGLVRRRRAECALWRGDVEDAERYTGVKFPPMVQSVTPPPPPPSPAKTPIGSGALILGAAGAIGPAKEVISQAQDAVTQGKSLLAMFDGMAPWAVVFLIVIVVAGVVYAERAKLTEHEGV